MQTFVDKIVTTIGDDGKAAYSVVVTQGADESADSAFSRAAALTKAHKIKVTIEAAKSSRKPRKVARKPRKAKAHPETSLAAAA